MSDLTPAPAGLFITWSDDHGPEVWTTPVLFVLPGDKTNGIEPVIALGGKLQLAGTALPGGFEVRVDLDAFGLGEVADV